MGIPCGRYVDGGRKTRFINARISPARIFSMSQLRRSIATIAHKSLSPKGIAILCWIIAIGVSAVLLCGNPSAWESPYAATDTPVILAFPHNQAFVPLKLAKDH